MGEGLGRGDDEALGEEVVVEVVARCGLLEGLAVGEGGEGLDPRYALRGGFGGRREGAQQLRGDFGVEGREGAEVGAGDAEA